MRFLSRPHSSTSPQVSSSNQHSSPHLSSTETKKPSWERRHPTVSKAVGFTGIILLLFVTVAGVLGWYTYATARQMQKQANLIKTSGQNAYQAFKEQNLPKAKQELDALPAQVETLQRMYHKLGYYRFIPIARGYYLDGEHGLNAAASGVAAAQKTIAAIEPYADVLGFSGEGTFQGGSAENRLKLIIETLDKVLPQLDEISGDLDAAGQELAQIDASRYPQQIKGMAVRSRIEQAQSLVEGAAAAVTDYRPVLEQLPDIAGGRGERKKYLILFQNDNELRPTGGFLTAYATIFVQDGVVTPEKSDDIYELDKKYRKKEPIPPALGRYLTTEKMWNLRDKNIDPDFKNSMETFLAGYKQVPGEPQDIDGIIAIDTEFVTSLLDVLGPVKVDGYGTFSTETDKRCDCPQIIYALSEIITRPTPYLREDRKGILGPLMRGLLTKAYDAPRQQWPALFQSFGTNLAERHIQFYFLDEKTQTAAETLNAAGRMTPPTDGSDFFSVINANLGGAKSNLFVTYDMKQEVSAPTNGEITKTVEITYKNPRRGDNCNLEAGLLCLNSTLRDWTRIYLPVGSKLTSATGFTSEAKVYDENGFTVIDGFFILEPMGTAKIKLTYTTPYTDTVNYKLQLFKQAGITAIPVLMDVNGNQEEFTMRKDMTYETAF